MDTQELLRKVRRLEIRTSRFVNDVFAGEYQSTFKGRGMEFAEVREYQPGDDIRTLDWNVTARMRRPYVKRHNEERELTVMLMVDTSSSVAFGTQQLKGDLAAEICALLAFSAIKNNDKVGLILFGDKVEKYVPPKKGRTHVLRIVRDLLEFLDELEGQLEAGAQRRLTDISAALEHLNRITRRHAVVFLLSDFKSAGFETSLRITHRRHDVIAVTITDPWEKRIPGLGWYLELEDAEMGEQFMLNTRDLRALGNIAGDVEESAEALERLFSSMGMDRVNVTTGQSYVEQLSRVFRERAKRMR